MTRVGIFGAAGYGGVDMIRLLVNHPQAEITYLAGHTTVGEKFSDLYPFMLGTCDLPIEETSVEVAAEKADVLAFALPAGAGTEMIKQALSMGKKVIDFSADYRLKNVADYEAYYAPHPCPELIQQAVYGLPELHREDIKKTQLVAVPGCYPTSATLALAPAVKAGIIDTNMVIVDSKSGVSGSGRSKLTLGTHFAEVNESVHAYNVAIHRHTPEIEQELSALGSPVKATFSPHLIPMIRGILSTCYAPLKQGMSTGDVLDIYHEFYEGEPFIRVLQEGKLPRTKDTTGSNRCHIGIVVDKRYQRLVAIAAIDNLTKGLAGAAVQCMNLMLGYPETMGLEGPGMWP
jgi:N-acetyl-gamma-glutamyl-phosphate reductase